MVHKFYEYSRDLKVGCRVYALKGSVYGVWYKARIMEVKTSSVGEVSDMEIDVKKTYLFEIYNFVIIFRRNTE